MEREHTIIRIIGETHGPLRSNATVTRPGCGLAATSYRYTKGSSTVGNNFMTHRLPFVLTVAIILLATSLNGAERTKVRWPPTALEQRLWHPRFLEVRHTDG